MHESHLLYYIHISHDHGMNLVFRSLFENKIQTSMRPWLTVPFGLSGNCQQAKLLNTPTKTVNLTKARNTPHKFIHIFVQKYIPRSSIPALFSKKRPPKTGCWLIHRVFWPKNPPPPSPGPAWAWRSKEWAASTKALNSSRCPRMALVKK